MKKILVIFAVIFYTLPCLATQWKDLNENLQIDVDSIEPYINDYGNIEPDQFIFWVKKTNDNSPIFIQLGNYYKTQIGYFVDKEIINCKLKKIAIKSNYIYGVDSKLIHKFDFKDYRNDWSSIVPDSKEQLIFDEIFKFKLKYDEENKKLAEEKAKKEAEKNSEKNK